MMASELHLIYQLHLYNLSIFLIMSVIVHVIIILI